MRLRLLTFAIAVSLSVTAAFGQEPVQVVLPVTSTNETFSLTFPEGRTVSVKLSGTERLPRARGEAKIERKRGTTEIEIELDDMKPANGFGGDYVTYVLWSASPEGLVTNLGEFVLSGSSSKLNLSTRLQTFGLLITAEPHFLVRAPSRFVVLEMVRTVDRLNLPVGAAKVEYRGEQGKYRAERESLADVPARRQGRTDLAQAQTAVRLAAEARAEEFALPRFTEAKYALQKAEEASRGRVDERRVVEMAKEVVRLAYEAQISAEDRAVELALAAERKARADEQARLERERQQAQVAQAEEARLRAEADAARARALIEQERAQQQAAAARSEQERAQQQAALAAANQERAQQQAALARADQERAQQQAALAKAEQERAQQQAALAKAEEARMRAEAEAAEAAKARSLREAEEARAAADRAERERSELRARLLALFNSILPTSDTERGLVVNIGDVLFDTGRFDLRSEAKEKLARFSGIILNYPELSIVSEGHTDTTGSAEFNQQLSERRASAVRDYLLAQGLPAAKITSVGRGFSAPVAENNTAAGRQKNRRVELIISGDVIGTQIGK